MDIQALQQQKLVLFFIASSCLNVTFYAIDHIISEITKIATQRGEKNMTRKELGSRLLEERKLKGLSQTDVAKNLGIKRTTYATYERGEHDPNIEFLTAFCKLFNITMNDLVKEEEGSLPQNVQRLMRKVMNADERIQSEIEDYLDYLLQKEKP